MMLTMFWLYLQVVDVVVVLVVEDPDAVEAAGWGTVVEVVLAQVGHVINEPEKDQERKRILRKSLSSSD